MVYLKGGGGPQQLCLGVMIEFLQQMFDGNKATSILKVYLAAISACHTDDGKTPGSYPLAWLRVPRKPLMPTWELLVVLCSQGLWSLNGKWA